jgi:two-component system nitrate/nitrite response regulator NarL
MALRCLLVDDDTRFLESARELLELEGLAVDTASTGAQAVRRTSELRPDLVLLDIGLGGETGFEVARKLHAAWSIGNSRQERPKIILISSYAAADFGRLIEASPVLGFIPKSSLSGRAIRELLESD